MTNIGSSFIKKHDNLESLPLVPLRDIVVFPYTMVPFVVGRRSSLLAVEQALLHDKAITGHTPGRGKRIAWRETNPASMPDSPASSIGFKKQLRVCCRRLQ